MSEKPTLMWHADAEGKCHQGCEAWAACRDGYCRILHVLAWEVFERPTPAKSSTCPFAILASVLCCGKTEETQGELTAEQLERICSVAYGYKNDMMQGNCLQLVRAVLEEAKR